MKFLIGKKLDMTQVWQGEEMVTATRVQAGPCPIVQIKTDDKDGYGAVQLGFGERKAKNIKKPQKGHLKKLKSNSPADKENVKIDLRYLREFRSDGRDLKVGDIIDVGTFVAGDIVDVVGVSKGRGFQGVVKRYGFKGSKKTHGNKDQLRMPGSIGATGPAHVFKGKKMPGRMGGDRTTVKNLEIIKVDEDNNILLIKGAVPGARNGLLLIQGEGELQIMKHEIDNTKQTVEDSEQEKESVEKEEEKKAFTPKEEQNVTGEIKREKVEEEKNGKE